MSPKCIRVGIADDDEFVRVLLTGALGKSAQVQVVAAVENGEEAVELASSGQIDVQSGESNGRYDRSKAGPSRFLVLAGVPRLLRPRQL